MTFFSLNLCKEMQAAGLVSNDMFWYPCFTHANEHELRTFPFYYISFDCGSCTPAFTAFDLIAPTETARSNAKKWWGEREETKTDIPWVHHVKRGWMEHRLILVDIDTTKESVEDYVRRTRKK